LLRRGREGSLNFLIRVRVEEVSRDVLFSSETEVAVLLMNDFLKKGQNASTIDLGITAGKPQGLSAFKPNAISNVSST
jgi:hypothetical protein